MGKRITDAKQDSNGNITHVKLSGNQRFTTLSKAVQMAENGQIENAHAVRPKSGNPHLRTNPDGSTGNNLDELAKE